MVYGSLFTGMGGADIGARGAGFELAWGNELDPAIAEVGNFNLGNHIRVGDLLEQDPRSYEPVDALHMSPPCTRASTANQTAEVNEDGLKESPLDMALANKCIEFVEVHRPQIVALENVWAYRKFQSWRGGKKCEGIQQALYRLGYWISVEHVNCADIGGIKLCPLHDLKCIQLTAPDAEIRCNPAFLPKTLAPDIVAALAGMRPTDQAMHLALDAVGHLVKVISQDTAANAVPQELERAASSLRARITQDGRVDDILMIVDMFVSGSTENLDENIVSLLKKCLDAPLLRAKLSTISTATKQITLRKILECIRATEYTRQSITWKNGTDYPDGRSGTDGTAGNCPLCRHRAVPQTRRRMIVRAVRGGFVPHLPAPARWVGWYEAIEDILHTLPDSQFAPWQLERLPEEIKQTLMLWNNEHGSKAFIIDGKNSGNFGNGPTILNGEDPIFTIQASQAKGMPRAFTGCRIVAMTPRALARFQSIPDWVVLPESKTLAAKVIGNAVPPLVMEKVYKDLRDCL
jgi:site-specific DNA-cytosine methylase